MATPAGNLALSDGALDLTRAGAQLHATVHDGILTHPNGSTTVMGTTSTATNWLPWLLLGVVAATPVGAVAARRAVVQRHLQYARDSIAIGNFAAAARQARRAARQATTRTEAHIVATIADIRGNDLDRAAATLQALEQSGRTKRSTIDYLNACLAAEFGQHAKACHHLQRAIAANPNYANEANANPILEAVADST